MNLNISAWSIRNPIPSILLFALLTFAGIKAYSAMQVQNFPDIQPPTVTVQAGMPGTTPAQLETDVARKIEGALMSVQGIKHIQSTLSEGSASISIQFELGKSLQEALDETRDAVARVRGDLPAALPDPVVSKSGFAVSPILTYAVASPHLDEEAMSWFIDHDVSKALLAVDGVGAVKRIGGVKREILIALDPARLLALGATASDISRQLREVQREDPAGRVDLGGGEQSVRMIGSVQTAEQIAALELTLSDGRRIRLDDVAAVTDTVAERRSIALLDGKPVVGFEVLRARGAGELDVAAGVRRMIEGLAQDHAGLKIEEVLDFVAPVEENYKGSMWLLYEGAALAILVVFLFLRDGRATLVSAVALPLSVIPTFAVMHALGFSFNVLTLLSLSLVVGLLVDDAIVEVENIERHMVMGKTPLRAAEEAANEIGLAVIATSFTLIAVFLPTAFMTGTVGMFFSQFGWTAAIAVFFSLVVARMLTPMMAAYLLRAPKPGAAHEPGWVRHCLSWTQWCLRHRLATLLVATVFFGGGILLALTLPGGAIPQDDNGETQVTLTLPPGSVLGDTLATAESVRGIVLHNPQVRQVYTAIGASGADSGPSDSAASAANVRTAVLAVKLTHRDQRPGIGRQAIESQLRDALKVIPGARIKVGGDSGEIYELVLAGDDGKTLARHARQVERELRTLPGIGAVTSSASLVAPELVITPDFARAADLGVSAAAIAETVRIATSGDYDRELAKLNLSERQVPIVVRLAADARTDIDIIRRLPISGSRGPVPLENVATIAMGSGATEISRYDRKRNISIQIELNGRALDDVERDALALPSLRTLPAGVTRTAAGDAELMQEMASGFAMAMLTGVLCIYLVLILLMKDFAQPVTILVALALSVPGAFLALFITGHALSMPSMIGLLMLMGIATKNSILLVDYIILARREHGMDRLDAIVDACRKRVRPIVMTTVAMGAGMIPIALGLGADPSFRAPMAVVVIGGLITSTFLSILVVPVVYSFVDDAVSWFTQRIRAAVRRSEALSHE